MTVKPSCRCGYLHLPGQGGPRCTNVMYVPQATDTACGDPDCDGRCSVCDEQRRQDVALDESDARRVMPS